jgi:hypothetical protein
VVGEIKRHFKSWILISIRTFSLWGVKQECTVTWRCEGNGIKGILKVHSESKSFDCEVWGTV